MNPFARIRAWLNQPVLEQLDIIMATQAQLATDLRAAVVQMQKAVTEIKTVQTETNTLKEKVAALEKLVASDGEASQELIDAVAAVKAQAQVVDDEIPDAPTVPVVPPV